jgi:hypothetical protein
MGFFSSLSRRTLRQDMEIGHNLAGMYHNLGMYVAKQGRREIKLISGLCGY